MKKKFFYAAAVQGIQKFIFQTDKLKEIVGASEMVEQICTTLFEQSINECGGRFKPQNLIIGAAGNIKYIIENEDECKNVYLQFPKKVMEFAPGITISQVVEPIDGELRSSHFNKIEDNLKKQRNIQPVPVCRGMMISERSRRTGMPGYQFIDNEVIDLGTYKKIETSKQKTTGLDKKIEVPSDTHLPYDFEELSAHANKNWLAVIHADGNGLGKILQKMGAESANKSEKELIDSFRNFSKALEKSTIDATNIAIAKTIKVEKATKGKRKILPFRPIVLGGDDLTIITRAEDALKFLDVYLNTFEEETFKNLGTKLTVCAGVSFIKSSYPFYYGYELAEMLCSRAKKESRAIQEDSAPSSIMFYKVQSSFITRLDELIHGEMTCYDGLSFANGPYYLDEYEGKPNIKKLIDKAKELLEDEAPASQIRRWLTDRYISKSSADMLMERTIQVLKSRKNTKYIDSFGLDRLSELEGKTKCEIYDLGTIASLIKKDKR